ncbi:sensor domain-containing diguanylate cyclase [Marinobacter sp. 1Y8]
MHPHRVSALHSKSAGHYVLRLILLLCTLLPGTNALALNSADCPQVAANMPEHRASLLNNICYYIDKRRLTNPGENARFENPDELASIQDWQRSEGDELIFTQSSADYWLKITMKNTASSAGYWFLMLSYAPLDNIAMWVSDGDGYRQVHTGDHTAFSSRDVDYRYYLVPILLEGNAKADIYMRINSSGAINLPLSIEEPATLISQSNALTLTHGLFYGALLIFSAFNLLLFFSTGTAYYFFNAFYMLATGLFLCSMAGLSFQYLWPNVPWLANMAIPLSEGLSTLAFILFGRSFLDIDEAQPRLSGLLKYLASFSVLVIALCFVLPYSIIIKIATLYGLFCIVTLFVIGIQRWLQGYSPAKWYVFAWSTMAIGTCIYALAAFGYLADFLAQEILMQTAVGVQVILLNYAMVQRWRLLTDKVLSMETAARHELEIRVDERTTQLRDTMRQLEVANQRLEELSIHDDLTGLHNRRHLDAALPDICAEGRRLKQPVALIMLDADRFKTINDTFGHPFGDRCLKVIAETLLRHIKRPMDIVVRFGGEEFAVVLPKTELAGAIGVAEAILADMASQAIETPDGDTYQITLSAGVAVYDRRDSLEALYQRADKALYQAKETGRNRVCAGEA